MAFIEVDTVVVGGGAMGSATAWQLAKRGREVVLLERFGPGHKNGASHGATRNFNVAYTDPVYQRMVAEAAVLWRELELSSGTELLTLVGLVNHGAGVSPDSAEVMGALGARAEMLDVAEAGRRWPGIRFDTRVMFMPGGGRVHADAAVLTLQAETQRLGGQVNHHTEVLSLTVRGDDRVEIRTNNEIYLARQAVVTVGAWTTKLLGGAVALPTLVVTQEQPAHFAERDTAVPWPSFNHNRDLADARYDYWYSNVYGMLTPGEGIKAGWHGVGPVMDPDARTFTPEPIQLAALQRYARDWLPGVDPDLFVDVSCTYTTSPDSNFVLDRVGPLVVGAGFSGQGFKFTPTIGRMLADLVEGVSRPDPIFALGSR
jgi:sarcosine oxidase